MQEVFGYWLADAELRAAAQVRAGAHASAAGHVSRGAIAKEAGHDPRGPSAKKGSDPFFAAPFSVLWLAVALLVASIVGCIVTIVLALGQPDGALPDVGERLLNVPAAHAETER